MTPTHYSNVKKLAWLPDILRDPLVKLSHQFREAKLHRIHRRELKQSLRDQPAKKIIVGAGGTKFKGWIPTNKEILNLLLENDWTTFLAPNSIDAILAEHVWEHFNSEEAKIAAMYCFKYLKHGGYLRVAVPDGYHSDPNYIAQVKPGGYGPGADDHKVLYNYRTLSAMLEKAGFKTKLLEWFDEQGKFHHEDWNVEDGLIRRSTRFDPRNSANPTAYTSLIIDAIKP